MEVPDAIWSRARGDLVIRTEKGEEDVFLWEHAARVARTAEYVSALPVVASENPDPIAVCAAALYHDFAWAAAFQKGAFQRIEILTTSLSRAQRELSVTMLEERLSDILPGDSLARAAEAIRTVDERKIASIEGRIVAEAIHLDEVGLLYLWRLIRRYTLDGKGTRAVVERWRREHEYHYWTSRLQDEFHFDATRRLAQERVETYARFMEDLEPLVDGLDVKALLDPSSVPKPSVRTKPTD